MDSLGTVPSNGARSELLALKPSFAVLRVNAVPPLAVVQIYRKLLVEAREVGVVVFVVVVVEGAGVGVVVVVVVIVVVLVVLDVLVVVVVVGVVVGIVIVDVVG